MPQIALIAHQHNHNVRVRVISQLLQPPRHVLVCLVLGDVVHQQGAHGTTVVSGCDRTIALLAGRVPDLRLDGLAVDLNAAGCEFNADGGLAVEVEFVAGESREQVGLADAAVAYQDDLEEELWHVSVEGLIVAVCGSIVHRIHRWPSLPSIAADNALVTVV